MPNRIIKESICTSDSIDGLSWFEECFFYRLIVSCDDYGRMDARPPILRARLFPLKTVTDKQVEAALQSLRTAAMIDLYVVDGHSYLQLRTWGEHQRIRNVKEKYPAPDFSNSPQLAADCGRLPLAQAPNPIQSESNPNPIYCSTAPSDFEVFWKAYPKKVGKGAAQKSFEKIDPSLYLAILAAIEAQKKCAQWQRDGGQYIPYPATWLNQRRWEDEITEGEDAQNGQSRFSDVV